jgi:serine/threonine-protein kinase RsbT
MASRPSGGAVPDMIGGETVVAIASSSDIVTARQLGRALAASLGFTGSDLTVIATAISELARNIIEYAVDGAIVMTVVEKAGRPGITILARDAGPGIVDVAKALGQGYSTGQGLGVGLPGVRRLMDEFEISSRAGEGTSVTVRKWRP